MTRTFFLASLSAIALAACSQPTDDVDTTTTDEMQTGETMPADDTMASDDMGDTYGDTAETDTAGGDMTPSSVDVVEAASAAGNLNTFLEVAMSAGIGETLAEADSVTIFAPIDEAFSNVDGLDELQQDQDQLASLLQRHAVSTTYLSTDIPEGETEVETLSGETLTITNEGGSVTVTGPGGTTAMVVEADIEGDNGVVHAIDTVLVD